jgi:branched-chain amino acid transport system ATP-binding protein
MTGPGGLAVENVSISFGGVSALSGVSLTVAAGEIVGIIGPNGAGKTTLFNIVSGFVRADSGIISYNGQRLGRHHPHDLTKLGIARTLQGVGLCRGLSARENVMLGAQSRARTDLASALLGALWSRREEMRFAKRADELMGFLGIAQHADDLPAVLPYAIQKRVALARALMAEPSLLLLDEPASGLSGHEMDDLRQLLRELRSSMAIALVEHHMDLVMATCDRLVVLNFGEVISTGTPAEVQADPEVTTAYLGREVRVGPDDDGGDHA